MMYGLVLVIHLLICLLLIAVILVMLGVFSQGVPALACYQEASARWCAPR